MDARDLEIQENFRLDRMIVEDIRSRTGVTLPNLSIAEAAVEDPECAALIYPILLEWLQQPLNRSTRAAIYAVFHSKNANRFLEDMLRWMRVEPSGSLAKHQLKCCLPLVVQPSQYEMVWRAIAEDGQTDSDYFLLPKLARCKQIYPEVVDRILTDLASGTLKYWQLAEAAKVDHPKIRELILAKADDPDPQVRRVARRLAAKKLAFPKGLQRSATPPWRHFELHSAEVDIPELSSVLAELVGRFSIEVPRVCRNTKFTEHLEVDEWVWTPTGPKSTAACELWFRLEDVDVIEIVLLHASERPPETPPPARPN